MTKFSKRHMVSVAALTLILLGYTLMVAHYLKPRSTVYNLDFWYHISLGMQLAWREPSTLVNGLYPLGYPYLLNLALGYGIDTLRFGQFLSWAGGCLALISAFGIIHHLTRHLLFAVAGTVLLLLNVHFLAYAAIEGNDMLAMGLQAAAIAALWFSVEDESGTFSRQLLFLHGLLLGLAYLARYTALILLPISLGYLCLVWWHSIRQSQRNKPPWTDRMSQPGDRPSTMPTGSLITGNSLGRLLTGLSYVLLPFLLTIAVQGIPSWLVYGQFFYNEQAKNVWFGIYGQLDWVNNWGKVPATITLTEVIALDVPRFLTHWLHQLRAIFLTDSLWPLPFHIGWILTLPALLVARRPLLSRRLLLLAIVLLPLGITALAWLMPRFLLLSIWAQAILMAWLIFLLQERFPWRERIGVLILGGGLLLAAVVVQGVSTTEWLSELPVTRAQEMNRFLRLAGMTSAQQVATNDPLLHLTDDPARSRYAQTYSVDANPDEVSDLLGAPTATNWRFLLIDYQRGFGDYAAVRDDLLQAKSLLAPLSLTDERTIYCLVPCLMSEAEPSSLLFANGMRLLAYQWDEFGSGGALTLYWQAEQALVESYKISVRVVEADGREIMQIDGIPQLWTYPTTAWPPGELVVDFYAWELGVPCESCTPSILVYAEASGEPLLATGDNGQVIGPLIPLTKKDLE